MKIILNITVPLLSLIAMVILWDQYFFSDGLELIPTIIIFICYLLGTIPTMAYYDYIKKKYEYPNRKKSIYFEKKLFKKNTFNAEDEIKLYGIVAGFIIAGVGTGIFLIHFIIFIFLPTILGYK